MFLKLARLVVVFAGVLGIARGAYAQQGARPDRPYRGLFAAGTGTAAQSLVMNASVGGAFDNGVLPYGTQISSNEYRSVGYGYLTAGTSYALNRRRATVSGSAATAGQYIPDALSPYIPTHTLAVGVTSELSRRTRASVGYSFATQPFSALELASPVIGAELGQGTLLEPILGLRRERRVIQTTTGALTRQLSRRTTASLNYTRFTDRNTFLGSLGLSTQLAQARVTRNVWKALGFFVGYSLTQARWGNEREFRGHGLEAGLDFSQNRGIAITRRTRLTFGAGSSAYRAGDQFGGRIRTRYYVTGNALLTHEIARSWAATAGYSRSINFIGRFADPLLLNSASATIGGLLNRRVQVQGSSSASVGRIGLFETAPGYRTVTVFASLQTAITRHLALGASVGRYYYSFDRAAQVQGVPLNSVSRNSARVYLSAWAPLFESGRRTNATR
jgi:hypothetical protein